MLEWIVTPGRLLTRSRVLSSGTVFLVPMSHCSKAEIQGGSFLTAVLISMTETQLT